MKIHPDGTPTHGSANPGRDRRRPGNLRLITSRAPSLDHLSDRMVVELIELAWSTGYLQARHDVASWRLGLSFSERVDITAATLARRHQRTMRQAQRTGTSRRGRRTASGAS